MKKTIRFFTLILLTAALFIAGGAFAYADEGDAVLTVQKDGVTVKTFTLDELQQIAASEGDKTYNYSAFNTGSPTFELFENVKGATVYGILDAAGISKASIGNTDVLNFKSADGYPAEITGLQLSETRYCYPNAGTTIDWSAGIIDSGAYTGKTEVPAIIELTGKNHLFVGQVEPNEENNPLFAKCMLRTDEIDKSGIINIVSDSAEQCDGIDYVSPVAGGKVPLGDQITFNREGDNRYEKIYYTLDGSEPDYGSIVYNFNMEFPALDSVCKPVIDTKGQMILKVKVKAYGKTDSDVQTFKYTAVDSILKVKLNGEVMKTYNSIDELKTAGKLKKYTYSGYNTYPTFEVRKDIYGVKVEDIINKALSAESKSLSDFDDNSMIEIKGADGIKTSMTKQQLFGVTRYYFPNGKKVEGEDGYTGGKVPAEALTSKKEVYPIIQVDTLSDEENGHTFLLGQISPEEQNRAESIQFMLMGGTIEIKTEFEPGEEEPEKLDSVTEANFASGSSVPVGTKIEFVRPWITSTLTDRAKRTKVYYIVDGEEGAVPGFGDTVYNYAAFADRYKFSNPPVLDTLGTHTISVKAQDYGRLDSDVTTFTYTVVPKKPDSLKAASTYSTVSLSWKAVADATGYEVYRSTGGAYSLISTIDSADTTSYKDTGLKTGTKYSYKVIAKAIDGEGNVLDGEAAGVSATPSLTKPTLSLKTGSKKATVKWSKVSGASGYVIYRSLKKSSGFKAVKTIKSGKTVSYVNKKLKKGKKYYFKIRAYRTVSGKKVYSSYSTVKYVKVK